MKILKNSTYNLKKCLANQAGDIYVCKYDSSALADAWFMT